MCTSERERKSQTPERKNMKKNILTIIFCMAGSAAICWLCGWKLKAIVWLLLFWAVLAVSVAGATLSERIENRKAMRKENDEWKQMN